jgi:hypothetical protein
VSDNHIITVATDDGLLGMWGIESERLEITFKRTSIGLDFTPPAHAVVVGEREYDGVGVARSWIVLDETTTQSDDIVGDDLVSALVALKDRHLCERIYVNSQPPDMADHVRQAEGLSHYDRDSLPQERQLKWPTYRSEDIRAGVVKRDVPSDTLLHAELDRWLRTEVKDPVTGRVVMGRDGMPLRSILFLDSFPTQMIQQSMRIGSGTPAIALWLALKGLETSQRKWRVEKELRDTRHPEMTESTTITGY